MLHEHGFTGPVSRASLPDIYLSGLTLDLHANVHTELAGKKVQVQGPPGLRDCPQQQHNHQQKAAWVKCIWENTIEVLQNSDIGDDVIAAMWEQATYAREQDFAQGGDARTSASAQERPSPKECSRGHSNHLEHVQFGATRSTFWTSNSQDEGAEQDTAATTDSQAAAATRSAPGCLGFFRRNVTLGRLRRAQEAAQFKKRLREAVAKIKHLHMQRRDGIAAIQPAPWPDDPEPEDDITRTLRHQAVDR
ncbi:hypothetical protein CYMTET_19462 [Cymbomonas tetramitiformis]|uniref:Uncharacterized protein n=1 Tax=Cymbomonas tetramitiformis TaxID=36881 RepID=A0AAE0G635_9CHLO|nr:hypothetical protein CYMTET_19462 [Cymbomonas tetramitiformis]